MKSLAVGAATTDRGRFLFGGSSSMRYVLEGNKKVIAYKSRLYNVWAKMKQRCFNPNDNNFANYGGRGITVCPMWAKRNGYLDFIDWANTDNLWWYFGAGQRRYDPIAPIGACTLDRVNNDGPYTPINCRWVDMKTQANNTRATKRVKIRKAAPKKTYRESHPNTHPVVVMDMEGNELAKYDNLCKVATELFGDVNKRVAIRYAATKSKKGSYRGYKFKILD